jgi:hypothetical protein
MFKNAAAYAYGVVRLWHCCKYIVHLDADIELFDKPQPPLVAKALPQTHWLLQVS